MAGFLARRLLALVPLLLVVSLAVFSLIYLVPGDAARTLAGGEFASQEQVDAIRDRLGLDDPLLVQYGRWLGDAVQFEFGESLNSKVPVTDELSSRFPTTFSLILGATAFALLVGLPAGIAAGLRPGSWIDKFVTAGVSVGISLPSFWLGLMLAVLFAVEFKLLPSRGYVPFTESPWEWFQHLIMPSIALGTVMAATLARQLRGALGDVLQADYVRTARSKGLSRVRVVGKHALKNAAMPAVTIVGLQIGYLFGGAVIVEQIFALPGVGTKMIEALFEQDIPLIQGFVMAMAVLVVATNFVVDAIYGYVNPKVRMQ